jgi:hypothetical protein
MGLSKKSRTVLDSAAPSLKLRRYAIELTQHTLLHLIIKTIILNAAVQ